MRRRFQHTAGEVAIIGKQNRATGRVIQPSDRKDPFGDTDQQIAQRPPAFGISERRNNFRRLDFRLRLQASQEEKGDYPLKIIN